MKKLMFTAISIVILTIIIGVISLFNSLEVATTKARDNFEDYFFPKQTYASINVKKKQINHHEYKYNNQIPEKIILAEVNDLSVRFNLIEENWIKLLRCEATGKNGQLDNLVCNPTSTACGLGQYLIRTWYATESWKQLRKARTDYKASLWEMALDLNNNEQDKWSECNKIINIYNYKR